MTIKREIYSLTSMKQRHHYRYCSHRNDNKGILGKMLHLWFWQLRRMGQFLGNYKLPKFNECVRHTRQCE